MASFLLIVEFWGKIPLFSENNYLKMIEISDYFMLCYFQLYLTRDSLILGPKRTLNKGDGLIMKKLFVLLGLLLAFSTVLTACGGDKEEGKESSNEFRVGLECAYAPFNWTQTDDSNGAVPIKSGGYAGGYDVEIAKQIAKGLGKKLVIVKTDWDGLLPSLTSGKIDAIIAGMSPTAERKKSIDFTDNYYKSELVVVVKKDGKFATAKTLKDLSGAKVTAQLDTFHYSVIDQITGVNKQTAMEDFPTMIVSLNSGKIDGYVSEKPGAEAAVSANSGLTYVSFEDGKGFEASEDDVAVAVGLKKKSNLTSKINEILSGISQSDRDELMLTAISNQPSAE